MNLTDCLDSFVVMKSLEGQEWIYWEKENSKKMLSYVVESDDISIILFRPKNQEVILLSAFFPSEKHKSVAIVKKWMKDNVKLKKMQTKTRTLVLHNNHSLKLTLGVENIEELREFFSIVF